MTDINLMRLFINRLLQIGRFESLKKAFRKITPPEIDL